MIEIGVLFVWKYKWENTFRKTNTTHWTLTVLDVQKTVGNKYWFTVLVRQGNNTDGWTTRERIQWMVIHSYSNNIFIRCCYLQFINFLSLKDNKLAIMSTVIPTHALRKQGDIKVTPVINETRPSLNPWRSISWLKISSLKGAVGEKGKDGWQWTGKKIEFIQDWRNLLK